MVNPSLDARPPVPVAAALSCPSCGAGIPMSSMGWAVTIACGSCGSILDAQDPNLAILQQHALRMPVTPQIPLGARGTWHGARWECIGCQQVTITVEGTDYSWIEYVLFNPYRGFLYLSEYQGHWNVVEKLRERPVVMNDGDRPVATLEGRTFKHFQTASARTTFAAGEFPWEVRLGDTVMSRDFIDPPFILSGEASDGELTWSLGTYTPSAVIAKAFGIEKGWHDPIGVFANQPNPHKARSGTVLRTCGMFLLALVMMLVLNVAMAGNARVHQENQQFRRNGIDPEAAIVTDAFTLTGRPSNVSVDLDTDLDNDWLYYDIALVNEATGDTRNATKQVSYYYGSDSDGRWTEGSRRGTLRIASVPAGRYFLRVGTEGGEPGKSVVNYQITVRRDTPTYGFYGLALLLLVVPPVFVFIRAAGFEQSRWAESDHAPVSSDDDSGDDE